MKYILILIIFLSFKSIAQVPNNSWTLESNYRFQSLYRLDTSSKKDNKGPALNSISSKRDTISVSFKLDTSVRMIYRTWNWLGKSRTSKFHYISWDNWETSKHNPQYEKGVVYFHIKSRGDIEWHPNEIIIWNNTFKGFRIEYFK